MDINDDALRALWHRQQPPSALADEMARRIQRHRRAEKVRRAVEIALTIAGIALLAWPVADGRLSPKSVVRDMYERAMTFTEYISFYQLARAHLALVAAAVALVVTVVHHPDDARIRHRQPGADQRADCAHRGQRPAD